MLSVKFGALNITVHPHDKDGQIYLDLFNYLYKVREPLQVRGNDYIYLSALKPLNDDKPLEGLQGTFTKLTGIEVSEWFDTTTDKLAEQDIVENVNIPSHLFPNAKFFNFIFFPKKHILISEIYDNKGTVSIGTLAKFFEKLFYRQDIREKFTTATVHVLPDMGKVEEIIRMGTLVTLELEIYRPNADDVEEVETSFLEKLERLNAEKLEEKYETQRKGFLTLDEETKNKMRVAAKNGKVYAKAIDEQGLVKPHSTENIPFVEQDKYDPKTTDKLDFLKRKALEIYARFTPSKGKFKGDN